MQGIRKESIRKYNNFKGGRKITKIKYLFLSLCFWLECLVINSVKFYEKN